MKSRNCKAPSLFLLCTLLLFFTACGSKPIMPEFRPLPDEPIVMTKMRMVSTYNHTMAVAVDGTLWGTGSNINGQLGDNSTVSRLFFDIVGESSNWVSVGTGSGHTLAIKEDGSLWAWGRNQFGQLGDGATINRLAPTQIGYETNWLKVSAGSSHTLAIRTDGSLWAWGNNARGQLGNGKGGGGDSGSLIPIQIGADTDWVYVGLAEQEKILMKPYKHCICKCFVI